MHIISRKALVDFWAIHPETKQPLQTWYKMVGSMELGNMNDILNYFSAAKVLNHERARFKVCGNNYRLIASFQIDPPVCWIKFLGIHNEYDKIDALTVDDF